MDCYWASTKSSNKIIIIIIIITKKARKNKQKSPNPKKKKINKRFLRVFGHFGGSKGISVIFLSF